MVLPFPQRGQEFVSTRQTSPPANGQIVRRFARPIAKRQKRDSAVRFFQDIHGIVHSGRHNAPQIVACGHGQGVPADHMVR